MHQPQPQVPSVCPACKKTALVDSTSPLRGQKCNFCSHVFGMSHGKLKRAGAAPPDSSDRPATRHGAERLLLVTGCTLLVTIALGWWKRPEGRTATDLPTPPSEPIPPRDHVRAVVEQFLAARTPDELLACVRDPAVSGPALRAWCAGQPGKLPLGGSLTAQAFPQTLAGARTMQTEVQFADGSNGAMLAVETSRGWFVDWLSFTGAGDLTVAEFLEKKPPQSTLLLVMAQQDSYYNGAYPSAATHQCLRLTNRDGTHVFYGYLSVENSAAAMVKDLPVFQRGAPPGQDRRPLAVRATFTSAAGKEQNQAEILLIAGEGWFVP